MLSAHKNEFKRFYFANQNRPDRFYRDSHLSPNSDEYEISLNIIYSCSNI